jgi:ketosteroid isomerase-like protein
MRRLVVALALAACGGSSPHAAPPVVDTGDLSWLEGDWGAAHWRRAGDTLYGVVLRDDGGFTVQVIDENPRRLSMSVDGEPMIEMAATGSAAGAVTFANGSQPLEIRRTGDALVVTVSNVTSTYARTEPATAPALEAADRAFSDATVAHGVDGWAAAFASDGVMLQKSGAISGSAIRDTMKPLLDAGTLLWAPLASAVRGDLGFTVGTATYTGKDPADHWKSSYVTIWRHQGDAWKVRFDTGRPIKE